MKQAVILCGGSGTRLGELTDDTPKPLLEVGGKPFIEHLIQEVTRYGYSDILLLTGYLGEQFEKYNGMQINHATISVVREPEPLGTWGGVLHAHEHLDDYFLLLNGDSWINYDLTHLHRVAPASVHVIGRWVDQAERYETFDISQEIVTGISARGTRDRGYINSGVYVVNKQTLASFDYSGPQVSFEAEILPVLASNYNITVEIAPWESFFIDIGVPEDFERAQTEMIAARTRPALFVDRDNTLTYDREGHTHHPDDMEFKPGAVELIKHANEMNYYVFVVTNQGGVEKGIFDEHYILDFHDKMQYTLLNQGAHIDGLKYETQLESDRRKPNPGMITELLEEWPIDTVHSFMIGDKESDRDAGLNADIWGFLSRDSDLYQQFGDHIIDVSK